MAKVSMQLSPQVAKQLEDMARSMCRELYGDEGAPQWGTNFRKLRPTESPSAMSWRDS